MTAIFSYRYVTCEGGLLYDPGPILNQIDFGSFFPLYVCSNHLTQMPANEIVMQWNLPTKHFQKSKSFCS